MAPEVLLGDPAAELVRGETISGVLAGVIHGEMYGVTQNLGPVYFEAAK